MPREFLSVDGSGRSLVHFRTRLLDWRPTRLPVRLPAGAVPLAVRVEGRWAGPPAPTPSRDGSVTLELNLAGEAAQRRVELIYALGRPAGWLAATLEVPPPELPVPLPALRRLWRLAPGLTPTAALGSVSLKKDAAPSTVAATWTGLANAIVRAGLCERDVRSK